MDDTVLIPRADDLNPGAEVTVDFWMKADADNFMDDCCQGIVTTDFYQVEISPGYTWLSGINFSVLRDPELFSPSKTEPDGVLVTTADVNDKAALISQGEWHYVAATYDGANLRLYIDGRPWGKPAPCSGAIPLMFEKSFMAFGSEDGRTFCEPCIGKRYFKGLLDEIRIFSRALSNQEIAAVYESVQAKRINDSLTKAGH